jgi:hypothetical protein
MELYICFYGLGVIAGMFALAVWVAPLRRPSAISPQRVVRGCLALTLMLIALSVLSIGLLLSGVVRV